MLDLNVTTNVKDFTRYLSDIEQKQIPFATARALTWTAKAAQAEIIASIPSLFAVTRKWWLQRQPTGIKIKSATKGNLEAVVYTQAYFADLQEEGGIKVPFKAGGILVPTPLTPRYGRKSGGAVKVLAGKKILRKGGTAEGDPIITLKSGKRGVFRRTTKKRLPIQLIYTYIPRAHIRPRLGFRMRAYRVAAQSFDANFTKSLDAALRTAK